MPLRRRTVLAAMLAAVAAPAVVRPGQADTPQVTLKLHHAFAAVSAVHANFIAPWARQVEAQSGGRLHIDVYPSMQLGGAPSQLFDQARDGSADIVWTMPSQTPGRFARIETFELPFVTSRRALVGSKALEDFSAVHLREEFQEVHPICFSCADRGVIHAHRAVHTIEEMAGLRLHVQTRFAAATLRAFGARAVPMPSGQLPVAINRHVIDGCVDPWHMMPPLKLDDLLKAHTDFAQSSLSTTTYVLAMNKAAYGRLPPELQTIVDNNSGLTAAGMAGVMWDLDARGIADAVTARGDAIVTLLPEAVAHWRSVTAPVIASWRNEMKQNKIDGAALLASAGSLLAKYADEPEPQPPQPPQPPPQPQPAPQPQPQPVSPPAVAGSAPPVKAAPAPAPVPAPAPPPAAKPAPPAAAPPKTLDIPL